MAGQKLADELHGVRILLKMHCLRRRCIKLSEVLDLEEEELFQEGGEHGILDLACRVWAGGVHIHTLFSPLTEECTCLEGVARQ